MNFVSLKGKMDRRIMRLRLRPIRVFCFHHVSDVFEPDTMLEKDWMRTDVFKQRIVALKKDCTFVPLLEVTSHLKQDRFRFNRYVALTADDGWASLKNILPWLDEQNIPVTLFLNASYLDGKNFRDRDTERYLTLDEIGRYSVLYKNMTVAMHGWEHKVVAQLSDSGLRDDIEKSSKVLGTFPNFIPYYAYPWGKHTSVKDGVLREYGLTPVLMDGAMNTEPSVVHRELLLE